MLTSLLLAAALAAAPPPAAVEAVAPLRAAAERVAIAEGLREALRARYVFLAVKPAQLAAGGRAAPFDPEAHLEACVAAEAALPREDDPLRFYDRMRRCTAAFEDGHLILSVPGRLPAVALGVSFRRTADGKVHLAARAPGLVRWLEAEGGVPDAAAVLAPGAELVEVDGVPAAAAVEALARYVPGSSAGARLERAVDALGRREFAYPAARSATIVLAAGGGRRTLALPWWIAPGAREHTLAGPYVRRLDLPSADFLDWSGAPAWASAEPAAGASRGDPAVAPEEAAALQVWRGQSGRVAARLGEATAAGGRRYCYVQLLTFHTETLEAGDGPRPLPEVVEDHLRGCGERGLDLVLDLRQNEGGYLSHASALARVLLPDGAPVPAPALLLRATERNEAIYAERSPALGKVRTYVTGRRSEPEEILEALRRARSEGAPFAPAFLDRAAGRGVFGGRVVALSSPACMSACDRLLATLKAAGRATLVGGPTEGAGGSQQEAKELGARWTDPGGRLAVSIPNAAMGVARDPRPGRTTPHERFFSALALENRPVLPDVAYATTVEDLTEANRGWRAAAEAALAAGGPVADGPVAPTAPGDKPRA